MKVEQDVQQYLELEDLSISQNFLNTLLKLYRNTLNHSSFES
jgi:hypothetical protein